MNTSYNVAVVGATGMVGRKMLEVLTEHNFPVKNLIPFASAKSAGKEVVWKGKAYTIVELNEENIKKNPVDFAIFSAGAAVSRVFAPVFAAAGAVVIDNSSCWRMDENVPLVVPEVNPETLANHKNIIANPNCSTIQAVVALGPLHKKFGIRRIVYSTYQAVSGAGQQGYEDLEAGLRGEAPKKFPRPIFGNVIPHIDVFLPDGYTKEEEKMKKETQKILGDYSIKVTATTVRVPVFHGHSESINVEFIKPCTLDEVRGVLSAAPGLILMDDPPKGVYPDPLMAAGRDEVFVGRLRLDETLPSGINMWVVADNIRKGAATNAVQIAEALIRGL